MARSQAVRVAGGGRPASVDRKGQGWRGHGTRDRSLSSDLDHDALAVLALFRLEHTALDRHACDAAAYRRVLADQGGPAVALCEPVSLYRPRGHDVPPDTRRSADRSGVSRWILCSTS